MSRHVMNISDETLSAFLDGELSDARMNEVREALECDSSLAERLAILSHADRLVQQQAQWLDSTPMPATVLHQLDSASRKEQAGADDKVISLPAWQQARQGSIHFLRRHAALAASIALIIGFAGGQWLDGGQSTRNSEQSALFAALESLPSGQSKQLPNTTLTGRFSFEDAQGRFCRQYLLQDTQGQHTENLACRNNSDEWQILARVRSTAAGQNDYQTATLNGMLDQTLDKLMTGSAMSLDEEATWLKPH